MVQFALHRKNLTTCGATPEPLKKQWRRQPHGVPRFANGLSQDDLLRESWIKLGVSESCRRLWTSGSQTGSRINGRARIESLLVVLSLMGHLQAFIAEVSLMRKAASRVAVKPDGR